MPTYEYICTACGYEFELVQRMTDPPRKRCLKCGKKVERKIGGGAGIIFKGSGFYITDYRSEDYKARQKAETAGKAGGSGAGSATGESKRGGEAPGSPATGDGAVRKPAGPGESKSDPGKKQ